MPKRFQEGFENIQEIKAYNQQESYLKELGQKLDKAEKSQVAGELGLGVIVNSAQMILKLGMATLILVGAKMLVHGSVELMVYLMFLIAASRIFDPIIAMFEYVAHISSIDVPIKRMKEIDNHSFQQGEKDYAVKGYDIRFDKVGFSYNENEPVLNDVSFVAKQGEVTALVGPSGGGKSTAAKLAARFWDANKGKITLGGTDISTIDPEALMENYSIVFQDVTLFNASVKDNIRLGKKGASDKEVKAAAKMAMCEEFISKMSQGYDTIIGENGAMLSGGERQRISIARALLKDAPVVLLDEATASLDVENETKIQHAYLALIKNKTVLIIAHRMRTVANADKLVVLKDGKVEQCTDPKELVKRKRDSTKVRIVKLQTESMSWSL